MSSQFEHIHRIFADATPLQLSLVGAAVLSAGYLLLRDSKSRHYPPGPPKLPIIGNWHNFPQGHDWPIVWNEWQKQYGDIVYVKLPDTAYCIVSSLPIANELLTKRANITSGRMVGFMITQMMGFDWMIGHNDIDSVFHKQRRLFRNGIGQTVVARHDAAIERTANSLALKLQKLRGNPEETIVNGVSVMLFELAYGQKMVKEIGQELLKANEEAMHLLFDGFGGKWVVNFLPWLRYVPSWMPGAGFKRFAAKTKSKTDTARALPYDLAVQRHREGTLDHCLAEDWLTEFGPCDEVKDALASVYFNGFDPGSNLIVRFLHAMFIFPDVARRVQEEIDSVTGGERFMTIKDRNALPYTQAVWKESIRWKPQLPIAVAHTTSEDQIIDGYYLPKGTQIHPNYGFIYTNPLTWGDPEKFRPERFLGPESSNLPDPSILLFGFGTRYCPGTYFADRFTFHIAVALVALFNILPFEGEQLPDVDNIEYTKDFTRAPVKFDCRFVPRNEEISQLLSSLALNAST